MLSGYELNSDYDRKNAMKEIIQEIILCALSRTDFFKHAAFYGGTALRIFYGLDRFSEDLDFSLKTPDNSFDLSSYLPVLENEVRSYGLNLKVESKVKTKESFVQSAFVKGNTREQLLLFYPDDSISSLVPVNEIVKIKFEVDTNPPPFACFEKQYRLLPIPYEVQLYDAPSLFAGKIHAVLCRGWKSRIKGRDLYDFVFYVFFFNLPQDLAPCEKQSFAFAAGDAVVGGAGFAGAVYNTAHDGDTEEAPFFLQSVGKRREAFLDAGCYAFKIYFGPSTCGA